MYVCPYSIYSIFYYCSSKNKLSITTGFKLYWMWVCWMPPKSWKGTPFRNVAWMAKSYFSNFTEVQFILVCYPLSITSFGRQLRFFRFIIIQNCLLGWLWMIIITISLFSFFPNNFLIVQGIAKYFGCTNFFIFFNPFDVFLSFRLFLIFLFYLFLESHHLFILNPQASKTMFIQNQNINQ